MTWLPEPGRVEPAPRRVRGFRGGELIFDTTRARYVWDVPHYPQYCIPLEDVTRLVDGARVHRPDAGALAGTVQFDWDALDAWFEEDERIVVHPRNPYVRVDALRSHRHVRISLGGALLAESHSPVLVFETGLRTRYYLDRTDVDWSRLEPSGTRTGCPYKGWTSAYWSVRVDGTVHPDLAWAYDLPTAALLPIAGLVAFYDEKLDVVVRPDA